MNGNFPDFPMNDDGRDIPPKSSLDPMVLLDKRIKELALNLERLSAPFIGERDIDLGNGHTVTYYSEAGTFEFFIH